MAYAQYAIFIISSFFWGGGGGGECMGFEAIV